MYQTNVRILQQRCVVAGEITGLERLDDVSGGERQHQANNPTQFVFTYGTRVQYIRAGGQWARRWSKTGRRWRRSRWAAASHRSCCRAAARRRCCRCSVSRTPPCSQRLCR